MPKISRIYVSGFRKDFRFTCCCVASIRHFYPTIPISLIKDEIDGEYDTTRLQQIYDVEVFETSVRRFGWGMSKLEPLFLPAGERCLILDSDTVFLGRVLDRLEAAGGDFVVERCDHTREDLTAHYFDPARLSVLSPDFRYPGYVFNSGHFVATTGLVRRSDFANLVDFSEPRQSLRRDIFPCGDQGLLNFVLFQKQQQGALTIDREPFVGWPPALEPDAVAISALDREGYPLLLHWAGPKLIVLGAHSLGDVLIYFAKKYIRDLAGSRRRAKNSASY
jgi:hypothetical protein